MNTIETFYQKIYGNTQMPVVVCERLQNLPIVYANASIRFLLDPLFVVDKMKEGEQKTFLQDFLRFERLDRFANLMTSLSSTGSVDGFSANLLTHEDKPISVTITANLTQLDAREFYVFYIQQSAQNQFSTVEINSTLSTAFQLSNSAASPEEGVSAVLAYIGQYVQVSRAYIFEDISKEATSNTFEWCAPGVEPEIQNLRYLRKADYNYDVIMNSGMYITDDIRDLPENDRDILAAQGIKSLAILPLFHGTQPLGYIGFDDCETYRRWSKGAIALLKNVASIVISLLVQRNAQKELLRNRELLQTISDNIENVIYVTDVKTNEIVFLNKTLADTLGRKTEDLIGKICWQNLQMDMQGPCPFCPIPKMLEEGYDKNGKTYTWEFQNTMTKKWYLLKDSIIDWVDGRQVHIETATEITHQKLYEEQLKQYASTDMMTGAYNREWGYNIMHEMRKASQLDGSDVTLVFLDVDGLKYVNDTYGHDAGDEVIIGTVDTIRSCIRQSDVLCRWGGDEFILLLKCGIEQTERIIQHMQSKLDQANKELDRPYKLGFSYGLTSLTDKQEMSLEDVIADADKRMYENKARNRKLRGEE